MNIQTINNKHYTELDVVMVETFKTNNIGDIILNEDKTRLATINPLTIDSKQICTNQHIYFLSNEKLKKDDWCIEIYDNILFQVKEITRSGLLRSNTGIFSNTFTRHTFIENVCKKIEATTNSSLGSLKGCPVRGADSSVKYILHQIPQQFIEYFITEFNKGNVITKVKVEVDLHANDINCDKWKIIINNNEVVPLINVLENTPFHKPDFSHLKVQTAVDWLIEQLVNKQNGEITTLSHLSLAQIYNQAKAIQQEHIEDAFDDGVSDVLKNFDKAYSNIDGDTYYKSKFKQ
jgi:hypothetical protein